MNWGVLVRLGYSGWGTNPGVLELFLLKKHSPLHFTFTAHLAAGSVSGRRTLRQAASACLSVMMSGDRDPLVVKQLGPYKVRLSVPYESSQQASYVGECLAVDEGWPLFLVVLSFYLSPLFLSFVRLIA